MKELFVAKSFKDERRELISHAVTIITEYLSAGYRLTLRQLYYQFVSKNLLANTEKNYKKLGEVISDARLAGLVDWDAIEDRVRRPRIPSDWSDLEDLVEAAISSYRLPRWNGQAHYVELWVEKDALAGVLQPLADEYHVPMMVNRGYSSQSAMYEASKRFLRAGRKHEALILIYLGDHDPSGEDMVRDIHNRLSIFGADVLVEKIALTMDQVEEHNPPPNPAKMSDSRAAGYVAQHGAESWEVDALPPNVLEDIIRGSIEGYLDKPKMDRIKRQEERDKTDLLSAVDGIMKRRKKK